MSRAFGLFWPILTLVTISALAAEEKSPAAKVFEKILYDHIGTEWYNRVQNHSDELRYGIVTVSLTLARDGTIHDLHVVSNTSKQQLSEVVVLDSIRYAKIPAPPRELLKHGVFQTDLSFKIFPNFSEQDLTKR